MLSWMNLRGLLGWDSSVSIRSKHESFHNFQNDLGETKTFDQKRFMIFGRRNIRAGTRLPVNFFVKYDELEAIPEIVNILVDGEPVCVSSIGSPVRDQAHASSETTKSGILVSDLPLQQFPSVTKIPDQVNNVSRDIVRETISL